MSINKPCPYCGAMIHESEAACQSCSRNLGTPAATRATITPPSEAVSPAPTVDGRALLRQELSRLSQQGWHIISQTETTAQLKRPRQWSTLGLVLFVVIPAVLSCIWFPMVAIAILGLIIVLADYLLKSEKVVLLDADELVRRQTRQR
jgi:hypothetical protein